MGHRQRRLGELSCHLPGPPAPRWAAPWGAIAAEEAIGWVEQRLGLQLAASQKDAADAGKDQREHSFSS